MGDTETGYSLCKLDFRPNYLLVEREQRYIKSSQDALMTKEDKCVYRRINMLITDDCNLLLKYIVRETLEARKEEFAFRLAFQIFRMIQIWFVHLRKKQKLLKEEGRIDVIITRI